MYDYKMHITPDTYLHSLTEKDCKDYLYIMPVGPEKCNEMSDVHYIKDAFVPYHEHDRGIETFCIDKGSVEVTICGKRTVVHQGDMLQIRPYTPHGFRFLEEDTIWRELFHGMDMYSSIMEKSFVQRSFPEKLDDADFMSAYRARHGTVRFVDPEPALVAKEDMPQVRVKGSALVRFDFDGVVCKQKVGRWETNGLSEIWEFTFDKDYSVAWAEPHANWDLFVVLGGSVQVEAAGERFVARERDIINIPPYTAHSITALEDGTILQANNCRSMVLRWMEDLEKLQKHQPEKCKDWREVEAVLRRHECYITHLGK